MSEPIQPQLVEPQAPLPKIDIDRAKAESHFAFWWDRTHEKHPRWQRDAFAAVRDTILWIAKEAFMVGVSVGMRMERDKHER